MWIWLNTEWLHTRAHRAHAKKKTVCCVSVYYQLSIFGIGFMIRNVCLALWWLAATPHKCWPHHSVYICVCAQPARSFVRSLAMGIALTKHRTTRSHHRVPQSHHNRYVGFFPMQIFSLTFYVFLRAIRWYDSYARKHIFVGFFFRSALSRYDY